MKYYKIINGEHFVGVGTSIDLRCFQLKHKILLICDESKVQYIQYKDDLYRAQWMFPTSSEAIKYISADIFEIDKDEYEALKAAIDVGEEIVVSIDPEPTVEEVIELLPEEQITVDYVKEIKIKEMSSKCNKSIVAGFDIVLSDGASHHFDLTTEDQLNLFEAAMLINQGEEAVSYHASGETYKFYGADDMKLIISEASNLRKYHTAYFNSLKGYINSLTNIEDVAEINYGDLIPAEYMSDVLKSLI